MTAARGTTNANARGNTRDRAARREWLVTTYRANVDAFVTLWGDVVEADPATVLDGCSVPACRCYRCGALLTLDTVTVDRIVPGCNGGRYVRNNIRPACGGCNSETGARLARRGLKVAR